MTSPEHLGKNLLQTSWLVKFVTWLVMLPVIFLLEFLLYRAMIKARNRLAENKSKGHSLLSPAIDSWQATFMFGTLLLGFMSLTVEVLAGPKF